MGRAIAASGISREELGPSFLEQRLHRAPLALDVAVRLVDQVEVEVVQTQFAKSRLERAAGVLLGRCVLDPQLGGHEQAIGVSNFYPDRLIDLINNNEVVPAVNQIETHPYLGRADYQALMTERDVQIESWGPFAEGRNDLFSNPTLSKVGEAHGKSVAQVVLRWLIQRGVVVIPKSLRRERMQQNFDVLDFELNAEEMAPVATLETGESLFFDHRHSLDTVTQLGAHRVTQ